MLRHMITGRSGKVLATDGGASTPLKVEWEYGDDEDETGTVVKQAGNQELALYVPVKGGRSRTR